MLDGISLYKQLPIFIPWIKEMPCTRPFGGKASLTLLCCVFSITTGGHNNELVDTYAFDRAFVNKIYRALATSLLFRSVISLEQLTNLLRNVEALLDLEYERSARLPPSFYLNLQNAVEIERYYTAAVQAIVPAILLRLCGEWVLKVNETPAMVSYTIFAAVL
jgi:hypothetical protein